LPPELRISWVHLTISITGFIIDENHGYKVIRINPAFATAEYTRTQHYDSWGNWQKVILVNS